MPRTLPVLLLALAAGGLLPTSAAARDEHGLVEMAVVDRDDGQWLAPARHRGQDWIAGTPGHRYTVRLTNTTGQCVLVVLSVDGVNAISGQTANPSQTGYVLGPWQSTQVQGWRKSLDHVAQFVFTDLPDSYAARTGRPDNVGVIGIAVFQEARPYAYEPPYTTGSHDKRSTEESAAAAARSPADAAAQSIGTGHGAQEWSRVDRTDFVRASRAPTQIREVRYDDCDALLARGVPRLCAAVHDRPQAFPGGFVADPPYRY